MKPLLCGCDDFHWVDPALGHTTVSSLGENKCLVALIAIPLVGSEVHSLGLDLGNVRATKCAFM